MITALMMLSAYSGMCMFDVEGVTLWQCQEIVECEWGDWRYDNPKDLCTYEIVQKYSLDIPKFDKGMGEYCVWRDPENRQWSKPETFKLPANDTEHEKTNN